MLNLFGGVLARGRKNRLPRHTRSWRDLFAELSLELNRVVERHALCKDNDGLELLCRKRQIAESSDLRVRTTRQNEAKHDERTGDQ